MNMQQPEHIQGANARTMEGKMNYIECKNKNEYRLDDNLYIRDIKCCQCTEKAGNKYILTCKIIERGKHEELLAARGHYYDLWTRQFEDAATSELLNG